jgi:hypothetical protein
MASTVNRSHYQVSVKNRDDLTKTFPHDKLEKAESYRQSLQAQKLKPKLLPGLPPPGRTLSIGMMFLSEVLNGT